MKNRPATRPAKAYDRRSALRRGAGILLFLLALAVVGPSFFRLAWDTRTPGTVGEWLVVSLAALLLAGSVAMIATRVEMQLPVTGRFRFFWSTSLPARYRARFALALAFSLLVHALILSLQFGLPGIGLPGLVMPWAERRTQASNLTVRLVEVPRPRAPAPASEPLQLRAAKSLELRPPKVANAAPPLSSPRREARATASAAKARARDRKVPAKPQPQILAQSDPQEETFNVPPPKVAEPEQRAPETAARKQTEEPPAAVEATEQAARRQAEEDARQRALALQKELEAKKQEEARREDARKQDEARRLALELEARKRAEETARQETEELAHQRALALRKEQEAKKLEDARKVEEARKQEEARYQAELKKQEEAKRLALEAEALRRAEDAARQQAAARQKELEARRQAEEAAARTRAQEIAERQRLEAQAAGQRERERLAAEKAPAPAPGALSGRELAAKALDQLRAARIDPARPPSPPASADSPRRRSVFGVERDVVLRMYVDSWRLKIERNGPLNYRLSASWSARDHPIVTVSIRSDGSLENVFIHRSSGVRELDEAVQRIARLYAPYSAFPPALARQYDVIEIRRVWFFDNTLRILE